MFSGIIQQCATIASVEDKSGGLTIGINSKLTGIELGESIAINGICLTVTKFRDSYFEVDISAETIKVTTVSNWSVGDRVNLERSLTLATGISGHLVSGHVDTVATIAKLTHVGECVELTIEGFKPEHQAYLITKGSIAVDGISLTINQVAHDYIQLMIIPHTLNETSLQSVITGDLVNIEFDYLARIVHHQLKQFNSPVEVENA